MKIYNCHNRFEEVSGKYDQNLYHSDYWEDVADNIYQRLGMKRDIKIDKVIIGSSAYPVCEIHFESGMILYDEDYMEWKKEYNESALREYGYIF